MNKALLRDFCSFYECMEAVIDAVCKPPHMIAGSLIVTEVAPKALVVQLSISKKGRVIVMALPDGAELPSLDAISSGEAG
ncbi:unnamed protein product, partial [Chrysoparadoxa australica]